MRANLRDKRTNLRDNGKNWVDVAYGVQSAAAFLGICVLKLWEAALSLLWMRTHRGRVFICPAAGGGYRHLYSPFSSS